jgi:RHS repeat-associated protein
MTANDSINGNWVYGYDDLNRMTSASVSANGGVRLPASWTYVYDRFGNRWQQNVTSGSGPSSSLSFDANNHIIGSGITYDDAGNVTNDSTNTYTYDAEGRIGSVPSLNATFYYDGQGRRGVVYATSQSYPYWYRIYDLQDQMIGRCSPTYGCVNNEYYEGNRHLVSYSELTLFDHPDWLGTERYRTETNATNYGYCLSDPFGDGLYCSEADGDISLIHFTGKERDDSSSETPENLDYFGARFYSSPLGRFMSPDPSGLLAQHPEDPQSWNLYVYARNNPLIYLDPNGLDCIYATDNGKGVESIDHDSNSGECGQHGGTWLSGYVDEDWAHYNNKAKAFEAASEDDNGQVNFAQFQAGAQTNDSGNCLGGCGSYGFASASADWLTGQLVGNSKPTDGSDPLDGLLTFMTGRAKAVSVFWKVIAGPIDLSEDHWAGPGGMGPPGGTGDWRAAVHDYNFSTNGLTQFSYFNLHLSPATSKALIQSNGQLMKTGGFQGAKEKMAMGVINALQWYANGWK